MLLSFFFVFFLCLLLFFWDGFCGVLAGLCGEGKSGCFVLKEERVKERRMMRKVSPCSCGLDPFPKQTREKKKQTTISIIMLPEKKNINKTKQNKKQKTNNNTRVPPTRVCSFAPQLGIRKCIETSSSFTPYFFFFFFFFFLFFFF
eukprot:Rhum_TRINITY_DN13874_c1_g1::Rhum_TRINITY_DN13874_c1_g1_i1::g.65242::m.65242